MSRTLGVVMDPLASINPKKDSTLAMMLAAQKRGWTVYCMEQADVRIEDGEVHGHMQQVTLKDDLHQWFTVNAAKDAPLNSLDALLVRKDPPFDMEYVYLTYLLEMAEQAGLRVLNKPGSIRDCNEKLFALQFPQCCPPHMVSRDPARLRGFFEKHQDVIFKPLDGMGGASIFRVSQGDPNLSVILETLTHHGTTQIMAQRYIPEIIEGDKRVLLINGEPILYALARIPAQGETRGNLAAGGSGEARPLTDRDRWICQQVGPELKARGLYFVGIDIIGDYLTEINVTCPTCIRELDRAYDLDIAGDYLDFIRTLDDHGHR